MFFSWDLQAMYGLNHVFNPDYETQLNPDDELRYTFVV